MSINSMKEGQEAAIAGRDKSYNPYSANSPDALDWEAGLIQKINSSPLYIAPNDFVRGIDDFHQGLKWNDNPHPRASVSGECWRKGWEHAREKTTGCPPMVSAKDLEAAEDRAEELDRQVQELTSHQTYMGRDIKYWQQRAMELSATLTRAWNVLRTGGVTVEPQSLTPLDEVLEKITVAEKQGAPCLPPGWRLDAYFIKGDYGDGLQVDKYVLLSPSGAAVTIDDDLIYATDVQFMEVFGLFLRDIYHMHKRGSHNNG